MPAAVDEAPSVDQAPTVDQAEAEVSAAAETPLDDGEIHGEEVILITGSAIERRELTTPAPVAILDKADLEASGLVSIGDILQNLPSQSGGINVQINNGNDGTTRVDLRGLGSNRTLVLVNGRRHVPGGGGANSDVDLNAIPVSIIERVEVLKDGASAIYGSDAIGGVVNIITRREFQGTEANVYTGISQHGDGLMYDVSAASGIDSDKGNIVFAAGFYAQESIFADARGFSKDPVSYDWSSGLVRGGGSPTPPGGYLNFLDENGMAMPQSPCPSGECTVDKDGTIRDFDFTGNSDKGEGDLYNYQPANYLVTPQRRHNVYSAGSYHLGEHVRSFFEASYLNRKSDQWLAPEPLSVSGEGIVIPVNNVYNPFGIEIRNVRRRLVEMGPRRSGQDIDTFRVVGGLDGDLPQTLLHGWRWELSYNYGRTQATTTKNGLLIRHRLREALGPSFTDADGVHCGVPGKIIEDCVPLNLFGGAGSITDEMAANLSYTGIGQGFTQQQVYLAQAHGLLARTPWGGDIALALGTDYRREDGADQPDPLTATGDTSGNKGEPTAGGYGVSEAFAELSVVPVTRHRLADWLELDAAARAVDYSTFGRAFTWKAGGLWRLPDGIAFRGTYSTSFRAPSVSELYSGQADSFPGAVDPCSTHERERSPIEAANCSADGVPDTLNDNRTQLPERVGGNPTLESETARAFTAGTVIEPKFAPGLALTVDYFQISLDNAVAELGASTILSNCYSRADRSDCEKITRDDFHQILSIDDRMTNIGGSDTSGIDVALSYGRNYAKAGTFRHSIEGTWLRDYTARLPTRDVSGVGVYDLGVYPEWKLNLTSLWSRQGVGAGANVRYIHGYTECQDDDCSLPENTRRDVAFNLTTDLFASYALTSPLGKAAVTVGCNNVFDQDPAIVYNGSVAASDPTAYDFIGRWFYTRITQAF